MRSLTLSPGKSSPRLPAPDDFRYPAEGLARPLGTPDPNRKDQGYEEKVLTPPRQTRPKNEVVYEGEGGLAWERRWLSSPPEKQSEIRLRLSYHASDIPDRLPPRSPDNFLRRLLKPARLAAPRAWSSQDLEQAIRHGLWIAFISRPEPLSSPNLYSWARAVVLKHIRNEARADSARRAREVAGTETRPGPDSTHWWVPDKQESDPDRFRVAELRMVIKSALRDLDSRDASIILSYFGIDGKERTIREIAKDLGISHQRVSQIIRRTLETLRAILPPDALELLKEEPDPGGKRTPQRDKPDEREYKVHVRTATKPFDPGPAVEERFLRDKMEARIDLLVKINRDTHRLWWERFGALPPKPGYHLPPSPFVKTLKGLIEVKPNYQEQEEEPVTEGADRSEMTTEQDMIVEQLQAQYT